MVFGFSSNQHHLKDVFITALGTPSTRALQKKTGYQGRTIYVQSTDALPPGRQHFFQVIHVIEEPRGILLPSSPHLFIGPYNVYVAQSKDDLLKAPRARGILLFLKSEEHTFLVIWSNALKEPRSEVMSKMTFEF